MNHLHTFILEAICYELMRFYPRPRLDQWVKKWPISKEHQQLLDEVRNIHLGKDLLQHKWEPIRSVLDGLVPEKDTIPTTTAWSMEPKELLHQQFNFPRQKSQGTKDDCNTLIDNLVDKVLSQEMHAETILSLLEKYTAYIPIFHQDLADVSVYEHIKSSIGIALCLKKYLKANEISIDDLQANEKPFLLIGADLSGIQSFIYDIISKNASKNLKGRSFYLQMLIDSVQQTFIKRLQLTYAHIIYASGGGLYILAPNTEKVVQELAQLDEDWEEGIFRQHGIKLYLSVAWTKMKIQDLADDHLVESWRRLGRLINEKKSRRYLNQFLDKKSFQKFFNADGRGADTPKDAITGEEIPPQAKIKSIDTGEGKQIILKSTQQQIDLGGQLNKTKVWVMSDRPISELKKDAYEPCHMGVYNYLIDRKDKLEKLGDSQERTIYARSFNDPSVILNIQNISHHLGFTYYGGNEYPIDEDGAPKTFDKLSGRTKNKEEESSKHRDSEGLTRLGVLRMDVDNLGHLFIHGFGKGRKTFSRYSTLSKSLDYFFKGYLNSLWKEGKSEKGETFKENTFIIYAGGDDLFIVGKWNVLIEMGEQIRKRFSAWTGENSNISISGGIAIITPRFPISKGASMAADAEKAAKNHIYYHSNGEKSEFEKDAFTLLGLPVNWEYEYPLVKGFKNWLVKRLDNGELPQSIIGKIRSHYATYKKQNPPDQTEEEKPSQSWRWTMAYDFSQFIRKLDNAKIREELDAIKIACFAEEYEGYYRDAKKRNHSFLTLLNLAARWAELELRTQ